MWIVFAFGSAVFAGATAILAKIGIQDMDTRLATALRTVVVLLFSWLLVFVAGSYRQIAGVDGKTLLFLILSGLATGGAWLCYFRALQLGDISKVVPIDKSSTVLTMLFAAVFLQEPLTLLKGGCILLIAVGTYLMLERKKEQPPLGREGKRWLPYALLSAVFSSLTAILGKVGIENVESNLGTAIRTGVVLIMAWLIVFGAGKQREIPAISRKSWGFIALSGLATGLSWLCYYRALQMGPASVVVPIDKLSILFTMAFAGLVLKERATKQSLTGLALIVAGTLLLLVDA